MRYHAVPRDPAMITNGPCICTMHCKVHYGQQRIVPLRGEQELYGSSGHAIVVIWGMFNPSSDVKSRVLVRYSSQYSAAARK